MMHIISLFKRKIGHDFLLNLLATGVFIATMQVFVYPQIAKVCSAEVYGAFLTVVGIFHTIGGTFGNSLNNVRLIENEKYYNAGVVGDFNWLLLGSMLFVAVASIFLFQFLPGEYSFLGLIGIMLLFLLVIAEQYFSVAFRLELNYKKILLMNVFFSLAYVVSTVWYVHFNNNVNNWFFIFLVGELAALVYIFRNSTLWKESFRRTKLFQSTALNYLNLIYMSFIGSVLLYFDRNFLFPLLGGEAVAVYFVSTVMGKAVGMVSGPMSGVLLSYFGQVGFRMSRKKFWLMNGSFCVVGTVSYVVCVVIGDLVVGYFYPTLYPKAREYMYVASLAPILGVIGSMARPAVLRYVDLKKLSVFNTLFLLLTVVVSYFGIQQAGLYGFCWAAVLLAFVQMMVYFILGDYAIRKMGGR